MRQTRATADCLRRALAGLAIAAPLLALLLLGPAGAARADDAPDPVVAQRGAVAITASQVREMLAMADPETRERLQHDPALLLQRVRDRLLQLVLLERAHGDKWDERPEVRYRAEQAKQAAIVESFMAAQVPPDPGFPTDKELATAYEANKTKLILPRQYHLAQILVAVAADAPPPGPAEAQKRAADLRKLVIDQHKDFAVVAKQNSDEKQSAANGGELGWVADANLVPPIRQALAGMTAGSISEPVRTPDGWHVLKLIGVKAAGPATPAEARDTLVRALRQERMLQAQRRYVTDMLTQEPIHIDQVELWKQTAQ